MPTSLSRPNPSHLTPALVRRLYKAARVDSHGLTSYLDCVEAGFRLDGTSAACHCYSVGVDVNGQVGVQLLIERMIHAALDYAIPRDRIRHAFDHYAKTGLTHRLLRLQTEAYGLFTHLAKTGEGGELLLFLLAEMELRLPQVLCKMSLKTSSSMHYHGVDGVHAGVCPHSRELMLYWGESKIHQTAQSAIDECFDSLAPFLIEPSSSQATRRRDLLLLRDHLNLDDEQLETAIKRFLEPDDPASRRVKYCGLALVGFDCNAYPGVPARAVAEEVQAAVKNSLGEWKERVGSRLSTRQLTLFDLHVLFVPFPSVAAFRSAFLSGLGFEPESEDSSG